MIAFPPSASEAVRVALETIYYRQHCGVSNIVIKGCCSVAMLLVECKGVGSNVGIQNGWIAKMGKSIVVAVIVSDGGAIVSRFVWCHGSSTILQRAI